MLPLHDQSRDLSKANTMMTVPLLLETIHTKLWMAAEEKGKASQLRKLLKFVSFIRKLGITCTFEDLETLRKTCFSSLKVIICGAAYLDRSITEEFACMGVNVLQGYGITECAPLVSVNRNLSNRWGSVGCPTRHCEVRIDNDEILVRGKNVMSGYYKMPELTAESMTEDGWFRTGDVGRVDKDGFLYITGRKKNLIVFKNGKKLSPEKLEERIRAIQLVGDVVVYGAMSGSTSDDVQVAASIYPNQDRIGTMMPYEVIEAIQAEIDLLNKELPIYQQIKMVTIRERDFSKTALQKVKRHLL